MSEEQTSCCCFFDVKTGTYILGFLSILGLFSEIEDFEPARFGANIAIAVNFIVMICLDTEKHRKIFFYNYVLANLILLISTFYMMQRGVFKQEPWVTGCDSMKAEGKLKDFEVANLKECQ